MGYDPDGQESAVDGGYDSQVTSGFSEDDLSVDDIESEFGDEDDPTSAEVTTAEVEDTPLLAPANVDGTARTPPLVNRKGSLQSSGCGSHENELRRSPPSSPTTYNSFSQNDAPDVPPLETGPSADASTMASGNDASFRRRRKLSRDMSKPSDKGGIPRRTPSTSPRKKRHRRTPSRSTTPAPASNHKSLNALAMSSVPETTIVESISLLKEITRCNAPLGLVLDIKSRHVSHRVWALVVDALRDAGARVEGIASFTISEIRDISNYCSSPCNEIYFFHSAGDVQQACYKGLLKRGDKVFFNAGSLLWHKKDIDLLGPVQAKDSMYEFLYFDCEKFKRDYCLQPYARIRPQQGGGGGSVDNDGGGLGNNDEFEAERDQLLSNVGGQRSPSTIQDYRDHFDLSIGLYCQEFAIDDAAIDFIVNHVNNNSHVYNLGLSWGGVNGVTVRGIQPDRFTNTDGFWNQRYAGASWDPSLRPSSSITDSSSTGEGRGADPVRAVGVAVGLQSFAQEQNPISSLALD